MTAAHPPVAGPSDQQLVSLVRAGDDRAFEKLFARYRRRVTPRPAQAAGPDRALLYPPAPLLDDDPPAGRDSFLESLMDTELYSMGAFFSDRHPELVDDVIARSEAIEDTGLERYARTEGMTLEEGFQTLITGLAVRYYKAING